MQLDAGSIRSKGRVRVETRSTWRPREGGRIPGGTRLPPSARQTRVDIQNIDLTGEIVGKAMKKARRAENLKRQAALRAERKRLGARRRDLTNLLYLDYLMRGGKIKWN